ncbi:MAG: hypothetical protein Q7U47_08205, partial [Paludibacter sp.]|nr:hypothetical protein [Paludibacter sp.]
MKRFIFNLLFLIWHGFLFSQTNITVTLDKSSILTINGSTNLLTFKLNQYGEQIMGKPVTLTATQRGAKIYLSPNKLSITVVNFKSDNFMAQSEFYKLMKADIYPQL